MCGCVCLYVYARVRVHIYIYIYIRLAFRLITGLVYISIIHLAPYIIFGNLLRVVYIIGYSMKTFLRVVYIILSPIKYPGEMTIGFLILNKNRNTHIHTLCIFSFHVNTIQLTNFINIQLKLYQCF